MAKIGIFGGSFNPIHNGHIYIAREVKRLLSLDRVIFIPTGVAPHKDNGDFASRYDRYKMVELAIGDEFEISDIEINSDKPCYAIDTMTILNKMYSNDELYYIIGGDSLADFMKWKNPIGLFGILNIVVVGRENTDINSIADEYRKKYNAKITICDIDEIDISATDIRKQFNLYGNSGGLVPEVVEEYISSKGIYMED